MKLFTMLALALALASVPMFGIDGDGLGICEDYVEYVTLADCTQLRVEPSCWCGAPENADFGEETGVCGLYVGFEVDGVDPCVAELEENPAACDGICDQGAELQCATLTILDVVPRVGQDPDNATPSPKKFADSECETCDGNPVAYCVETPKKNNHFNAVIGCVVDDTDVVEVLAGLNVHTQPCEEVDGF